MSIYSTYLVSFNEDSLLTSTDSILRFMRLNPDKDITIIGKRLTYGVDCFRLSVFRDFFVREGERLRSTYSGFVGIIDFKVQTFPNYSAMEEMEGHYFSFEAGTAEFDIEKGSQILLIDIDGDFTNSEEKFRERYL